MLRPLRRKLPGTNARQFTVYLSDDMDRWLRARAHAHGRTLSEQTLRILKAGRRVLETTNERVD
jgi:plasmid stability protein